MTIEEIRSELEIVETKIGPLLWKQAKLQESLRNEESKQFVAVNKITKADVIYSRQPDAPWWGNCYEFGEWIKTAGRKERYAEWNGSLHYVSDLVAGKFVLTPGLWEHVQ